MNLHTTLNTIGTLLREDSDLSTWLASEYGTTLTLFTGIDNAHPPKSDACPLAILFPTGKAGGEREEKDHHIGMRLVLYNEDTTPVEDAYGSWTKLDALDHIETFVGHVLKIIWDNLSTIGGDHFEFSSNYEPIETFPFVYVDLEIRLTEDMDTSSNLYD